MSDIATHSDALARQLDSSGCEAAGGLVGERLVRGGLMLLLALAALSGLVDFPGSPSLLAALAACLALTTTILATLGLRSRRMPVRPVAAGLVLVALAGLWMVVQLSPIAPASWQHPLWALSAPVLGDAAESVVPRIGLDPDAAGDAIVALLRDALVFWIAYGLAATTAGARRLLTAVAIIGVVTALATLVLGLGVAPVAAAAATNGAGVAGLGMVALLAVWIERLSRSGDAAPVAPSSAASRAILMQVAPLVGVALAAAAIVTTDSLGGLLVALIGLFGVLLAVMAAPGLVQFRRRAGIGLPLGAAFIAGALLVGVPIALHWTGATAVPDGGLSAVALAAQAIGDAPLLGAGAGTSAAILRLYGAAGVPPGAFLAAMIELGIPAALALVLGCAALLWLSALGVWRRRRNVVYACTGIGATLLVASDAVVGSSLRDPAISLIWCAMMGIACAQALRSDERRAGAAA
jgi:hypothetical protein